MLSFELSAIDVVLLIAVMVLLLLFIGQRRNQAATKSQLHIRDEGVFVKEPEAVVEAGVEADVEEPSEESSTESSEEPSATGFRKCVHHFGFLRNLPKNDPVPDECFGCPKTMRCLFPQE